MKALSLFDINEFTKSLADIVTERVVEAIQRKPVARLLNYEGAAAYLGLTESALRQRKSNGQVPDYVWLKIGNTIMFDVRQLDRWIDQMINGAA
jgi:hypothetical protein